MYIFPGERFGGGGLPNLLDLPSPAPWFSSLHRLCDNPSLQYISVRTKEYQRFTGMVVNKDLLGEGPIR